MKESWGIRNPGAADTILSAYFLLPASYFFYPVPDTQ